ncbi:MAG: recombinase family protein [bacterium]
MSSDPIPAISLIRVSTPGQATEGHAGLARQRTKNRATARKHGLKIVDEVEFIISGTRTATHPSWQHVIETISSGRARAVVAERIDRLTRSEGYSQPELEDLRLLDAPIYTISGVHDHKTQLFATTVESARASEERRTIMQRVADSRIELRQEGRWTQGAESLPMGITYERDTMTWSYNDDSKVVLELVRRYAEEDGSLRSIADALGVSYDVARSILSHPMYRGVMPDLDGGWIKIFDPPLIDDRLAARIDARRAGRRRLYAGDHRRQLAGMEEDPYLLRDVALCARCGSRMDSVVNRRKKKERMYEYRWYRCASSHRRWNAGRDGAEACDAGPLPIEVVHWAVAAHLQHVFYDIEVHQRAQCIIDGIDPDALQAALDDDELECPEPALPDAAQLERLRERGRALHSERLALVRSEARGRISEAELDAAIGEIRLELAAVEAELAGREAEAAAHAHVFGTLRALAERMGAEFSAGRGELVAGLLREAGGRIHLDRVEPRPDECAWPGDEDGGGGEGEVVIWSADLRRSRYGVAISAVSVDAAQVLARGLTAQRALDDGPDDPPPPPVAPGAGGRTKNAALPRRTSGYAFVAACGRTGSRHAHRRPRSLESFPAEP